MDLGGLGEGEGRGDVGFAAVAKVGGEWGGHDDRLIYIYTDRYRYLTGDVMVGTW